MTRKLKVLGLALVAVLGMSAVVASGASATTDAFVADEAPVTVTGTQHNGLGKFILAGQAVECTTIKATALVTGTTVTEYTGTEPPFFSGCTYAGMAVTVTMNGCNYNATGTTDATKHLRVALECPAGQKVTLTLSAIKCLITIFPQESEMGYVPTTIGSGSTKELTGHVTLKTKVSSFGHPTEGITCASLTNGTGVQEGTAIVTGESPTTGQHIGITDETLF